MRPYYRGTGRGHVRGGIGHVLNAALLQGPVATRELQDVHTSFFTTLALFAGTSNIVMVRVGSGIRP